MNRFIKWIWDARNIDEKNRKQAKKHYYSFSDTMDQLKHSSPGFQDLWDISDFLNIIEYTYFYNNTRESGFWSDGEFGVGKTRFNIIDKDHNMEINCTLDEKDQHITISMKKVESNSKVAELEFKNGQWASYRTEYDDILLDNIISIIWDKFIPLVYKYYKKNNTYCIEQEEEYRMHMIGVC